MKSVLKGNFDPAKTVTTEQKEQTIEDQFEQEALKALGGSIAYVAKKKVKWTTDTGA